MKKTNEAVENVERRDLLQQFCVTDESRRVVRRGSAYGIGGFRNWRWRVMEVEVEVEQ